jgi:hypothetical protein
MMIEQTVGKLDKPGGRIAQEKGVIVRVDTEAPRSAAGIPPSGKSNSSINQPINQKA